MPSYQYLCHDVGKLKSRHSHVDTSENLCQCGHWYSNATSLCSDTLSQSQNLLHKTMYITGCCWHLSDTWQPLNMVNECHKENMHISFSWLGNNWANQDFLRCDVRKIQIATSANMKYRDVSMSRQTMTSLIGMDCLAKY